METIPDGDTALIKAIQAMADEMKMQNKPYDLACFNCENEIV